MIAKSFRDASAHRFCSIVLYTFQYQLPEGGLTAGEIFGMYKDGNDWTNVNSSSFALNPLGDNLFLYCLDGVGNPHFIFGFSYAGSWTETGREDYAINETSLPESLSEFGRVTVNTFPNWRFDAESQEQDPEKLRTAFSNNANWIGSELRYDITPPDPSAAAHYSFLWLAGVTLFVGMIL